MNPMRTKGPRKPLADEMADVGLEKCEGCGWYSNDVEPTEHGKLCRECWAKEAA